MAVPAWERESLEFRLPVPTVLQEVSDMQVRLRGFGSIEVDGREYGHDIVIDGGHVRKRKKGPSKPYRNAFGHTPVSAAEDLPWGGSRLIVGTGFYGSLPIMPEVTEEAERRGAKLTAVPTEAAYRLISSLNPREVHAVLHVTC
jgi:hypothetical protein